RRFSSTDISGNRSRAWETWTTPWRKTRCGGRPANSAVPNRIDPRRGRTKPLIAFNRVDLPLPLAPSSTTVSPATTSRSTPNRICRLRYPASTPRAINNGSGMAEIGLQHRAVGTHLGGRRIGHLAAFVQDDHPIGDAHHQLDRVFDQQDADTALACQG